MIYLTLNKNNSHFVEPTSVDIYTSATTGVTTVKSTYGIDGDYLFFGNDIEIETGENESISAYTRVNIRKDTAIFATAAVVALVVVAPPVIEAGGAAIKAVATSAATLKAASALGKLVAATS